MFTHVHGIGPRGLPEVIVVLLPREELHSEDGFAALVHLSGDQEAMIVEVDQRGLRVPDLVSFGGRPLEVVLVKGLHEVGVPPVEALVQVGVPDVQRKEVVLPLLTTGEKK